MSALCFAIVIGVGACRDSDGSNAAAFVLVPSTQGANGCRGPNQSFRPPQVPSAVALATLNIGPASHVTAAAGGELLYATGADATVVALDVGGASAVETVLVGTGTVARLLASEGIAAAPELGAIAVLDLQRLLVVETTSNTILVVDRMTPDLVQFYAGKPDTDPGFADGLAQGTTGLARFDLDEHAALCPTGGPENVLVVDSGNDRIRWIVPQGDPAVLLVTTLAGTGTSDSLDGSLDEAAFDTPSGISLACSGAVIVSERGDAGSGNRIRQIEVLGPSFFGGFAGSTVTLAGDGTDATASGTGTAALVSKPVSPLVTSAGEIYWIDAGTGVLRRRKLDGSADCPLFADCASAVLNPSFPAGHAFSLTATDAGLLFVLDATAGVLWRVTP